MSTRPGQLFLHSAALHSLRIALDGQRGTGRLPHSALAACVKPPAFHKFATLTSYAKVGASIRHWRDAGLSNSLRSDVP